jgi:hypothetical protein
MTLILADKHFPSSNEKQRAEAFNDAKHEANKRSRETGETWTFRWTGEGYTVMRYIPVQEAEQ